MDSAKMLDDNIAKQADEIEALTAIYGTEWKSLTEGSQDFRFDLSEAGVDVTLAFHLPLNYPSESPPTFEMSAPTLATSQKEDIHRALNEVYLENIGETVIFQWIEKVREVLQNYPKFVSPVKAVPTVEVQEEPEECVPCPKIIHGEVIEDRKSRFQGHVAKITAPEDVAAVLRSLKSEKKIATATHNILAWRCGHHQDCDDDGEKAAGGRLLKLIDILNLDNVCVVVTRWYGGIQLHADRFRHINNAARQTIVLAKLIPR